MNEDQAGAIANPGFGTSGLPADFLLTAAPVAGFTYFDTNDTVLQAGRYSPVIVPPAVPETYPTCAFPQF
jgi:hypothetical protein